MTTRSLAACALTGALCVPSPGGEPEPESRSEEGWHTDFETALAEARETGRPLLVHFYTDWCGPCRKMEKHVLNAPAVLDDLATRVVGVKVNAEDERGLANRFGVRGFPSDVFVSPDGEVLNRSSGYLRLPQYVSKIDGTAVQFEQTMTTAAK